MSTSKMAASWKASNRKRNFKQTETNFIYLKCDNPIHFYRLISHSTLNILMPLVQNRMISKICGYDKLRADNFSRIQKMLDNVSNDGLEIFLL